MARKTFASTIALGNGMSIGVVSKILGHASMQITLDAYSDVIDSLMLQNVHDLKKKLSKKSGDSVIDGSREIIDARLGLPDELTTEDDEGE